MMMSIQNFPIPHFNPILFEDKWPTMEPVVLKILRQESVSHTEWQDLFYLVHSVCLWDDKAHTKILCVLKESIEQYIISAQARVLSHEDDQTLLKAYVYEWRKFYTQSNYLPTPFRNIDIATESSQSQVAGPELRKESIVRKIMLKAWYDIIFCNMKYRLQECAMKLIANERNGEVIDSHLVIGIRESYVNLCIDHCGKYDIYLKHFEKAYIEATETFYNTNAPEYLRIHGVEEYMRYAANKIKEEESRAEKYLEISCDSVKRLLHRCEDVLVAKFKDTILTNCSDLIKNADIEKLNLMFILLDRVPHGIDPMLKSLEDHIISTGLADMMASVNTITQDCEKYVEQLMALFNQFSGLIKDAFNNDPRFLTSRDKAYKQLVNDTAVFKIEMPTRQCGSSKMLPESKCPELLANYCDILLRKTPISKRLTSDEVEARLHNVLLVLKYVQNKDVFMRFHNAHLMRRLILETSSDEEKEENMVEWLREGGMPADYVNKLSRMFQDIKISKDLNQQFKEYYRTIKNTSADCINIKILNAGSWSRNNERIYVLPVELEDFLPDIEEFYKQKHVGRRLQWYHHMSNGTISFTSQIGKYELDVTTFQITVLFSWNRRPNDKITYENLRLATELPDPELKKVLWSLVSCPRMKTQLLLYSPTVQSPKEFTENTTFWINDDFAIFKSGKPQKRGKSNFIGRLQLTMENSPEEDNAGIVQLRILRVQEAIIKIMKMRKRVTNGQLHMELIDILKNMFLPSKKMIKEQVEWLMEQKYMKRDEEELNLFIYIS